MAIESVASRVPEADGSNVTWNVRLEPEPIVEDDVTIYSGATILGRITIGEGSVVGGNVWVVDDVPPGSKMYRKL